VSKVASSRESRQVILVSGHDLSLWEKGKSGKWAPTLQSGCLFGRNGFSRDRKEGDNTTPVGVFALTSAFGNAPDPGSAMPYRPITPNSYWSGRREDYNRWVEVPEGTPGMESSEHLCSYKDHYKWAMSIGYNMNPAVFGKGSAIFLHCRKPSDTGTAGCISVPSDVMEKILRKCCEGSVIVLSPDEDSLEGVIRENV